MDDRSASGARLIAAIVADDTAAVGAILAADPSAAHVRSADGVSALMLALYHGRPHLAERLAGARPELDVHEAAALGRLARLRQLLDSDAALVVDRSADGFTPLHFAAFFDGEAGAVLLLERGADPRSVAENALRVTPLHSAAAAGNLPVAQRLLDAGADPNARENGGYTALHTAADNGDVPFVELLLEHGADARAVADDGRTPAGVAADRGHVALAEWLAGPRRAAPAPGKP
jgi:ankyrin repeat protein